MYYFSLNDDSLLLTDPGFDKKNASLILQGFSDSKGYLNIQHNPFDSDNDILAFDLAISGEKTSCEYITAKVSSGIFGLFHSCIYPEFVGDFDDEFSFYHQINKWLFANNKERFFVDSTKFIMSVGESTDINLLISYDNNQRISNIYGSII